MMWQVDFGKRDSRGFQEVIDPNAKEDKHTGIHFMPAEGYKLEDYEISISSDESSKNNIACQDVYIKLLAKPRNNSIVMIDSQTNLAFEDGLTLAVDGPITIGKCKNVKIKSYDFGREVTLKGGLSFKDISDSIIRFEKPREKTKKEIANGLVSFNTIHKVDISIPENVKKAEIRDNFNGGMAILKGAPLNRVGISAFEIVMGSCNYSFHTQYSSLDISADIIKCESATFSSEYNGAIEVKSGKKDERSEFKAKEVDFSFYGNGILKAYTPTLIFDRVKINNNGSFIPIQIKNSTILVSPLIFFCSEALTLTNSTVTCKDGVNFYKTTIENSTIELAATPGKQNSFVVAEVYNSSIKNFTGDLRGTLNDASIDNLTMGENASINIQPPQRDFEYHIRVSYAFCNISGVEIKKDSLLSVSGNSSEFLNKQYASSPVSIKNSVVEGGSTYIYGDALFEANNSVFKKTRVGITNGYKYTTSLDSVVFSGKVDLSNVKEVVFSSLNESAIRGDIAPVSVRDQSIDVQNIPDYDSYLAIKEAQINPNASTKVTSEIEII